MKDKDLIISALLCLGLIIIGCGAAYIEGLNPNGGTYYMVRGFVSTEEQVGSSMIIAFMGVVGLLCCIFVKIAESLKNMNSKKILIGGGAIIVIAIIAVLISGSLFNNEVSIPNNAVVLMHPNDGNSSISIYNNDTHESYFIHCILNLNEIKVNGTNNYSVSPKSAIEELYNTCGDESNLNMKSLNVIFYDNEGNIINNKQLGGGEFEMGKWYISYSSEKFEDHSISSLYNESSGGYAELYLLLEPNVDENSPDYYCYELIIPLKLDYMGYMI